MIKRMSIAEVKAEFASSEKEAYEHLELVARKLLKAARWYPYRSKIIELQKPLLKLKLARRKIKETKL